MDPIPAEPTQISNGSADLELLPPLFTSGVTRRIRLLPRYPTYLMEREPACLIFKMGGRVSTLYIFPGGDISIPPMIGGKSTAMLPTRPRHETSACSSGGQGELAFLIVSRLTKPELDQLFLRIRNP